MNQSGKLEFLSPVGRIVQGHPMEKQDKNMQGQPLMTTSGQPTQRYFTALAFRKGDPEFDKFWGLLSQAAPGQLPPWDPRCRFSWKVMDGDGIDDNGKPNANKEGFAGHWVVKFQSSFPPRCFYMGRYAPGDQIQDPNVIKRGYYGRVSGTIEPNGNQQKPGIYVNLNLFELVALGEVITSGPDAAAVFGGAPAAVLPQGAQALPGNVGTPPAAGVPYGAPPAAPSATPGHVPPAAPGNAPPMVPTTPHGTILNGPGASAPPAMPGAVPGLGVPPAAGFPTPGAAAPAAPTYGAPGVPPGTPATAMGAPMSPSSPPMAPQAAAAQPTQARDPQGNVWPLAQLLGGGWTVDTLRANGYALF